jgi:hypothetical protein
MRKQLEKLVSLTEKLQDEIVRLNLPVNDKLDVSSDIKVYTASGNDYIHVTFSNYPKKVDVSIHKFPTKKHITANVSVLSVTDEDLDLIMIRSHIEIDNFVKDLETSAEQYRVNQIAYHLKQIEELQGNVQDS